MSLASGRLCFTALLAWCFLLGSGERDGNDDWVEVSFLQAVPLPLAQHNGNNATHITAELSTVTRNATRLPLRLNLLRVVRSVRSRSTEMPWLPATVRKDVMSVTGIGLAASSLNLVDVVWMLPFLVGTAGVWNALFFALISQLWATLVVVVYSNGLVTQWKFSYLVDYIIGFVALSFGLCQFIEEQWRRSAEDAKEVDGEKSERFTLGTFALLTVVGTFDQVLVYAPLMEGQHTTGIDLEIGILAASLATFGICYLASKIPMVLDVLKVIPIWLPAIFVGVASIVEGTLQ